MTKKSRKRFTRKQKDQSGCMWGLISIFDFRQGHPQKLLSDKKRGSRRLDGAAFANITLESLTDSCEICNDSNGSVRSVCSETSVSDTNKLSVKELMAEEMLGEQAQKKQEIIANGEAKPNTACDGGHLKKNRRWMKNKMSLDLDASGFVAAQDLVAERPKHRKHKSCSSVDLNVIVEELCNRIHQKDTSTGHGQDGEHELQSVEDPSALEKKLWESTKVLVNHFTDANGCAKDGKIQPSNELTDALQILNSNKDLFLKLLQDPSSQLVKHIQSSQDIKVEEGKFKVLTGSELSEQDIGNGKQHSFFWRRFKGLERNSSKRSDTSEELGKIVVLKPGPPSSGSSDMGTPSSSLPGSPRTKEGKNQFEKAFSPFSFSEFKRRLKQAMRKEQHGLSHHPSGEQVNLTNRDKKIGSETTGIASPSRDHFFIERIPKPSAGIKKVDKTGKVKDGSGLSPEQRVSNIYIEAKKHLAEIVGNNDVEGDNPGKRRPRSLGRILAYSGYSSPIYSPRTEGEMRLSPKGECQTSDEMKTSQDLLASYASQQLQGKQDLDSGVAENLIHEAEVPVSEPRISDGLPHESNIEKPSHDHHEAEVPTSEVLADSVRSSYAESQKELEQMKDSPEQLSPRTTTKGEQDTFVENEPSSSSDASTLISKVTENIEDLDTVSDATSRPSPISVLEPLFHEDDISPPGIKYSNVVEQIRPRQIQFGEETIAPLEKVPSNRICLDDDKYTIEFVKDVVKLSGLTWDELLKRSLLLDHLIDPSLVDEIDFLPDLLSCDFNALFDLISEVLIEICWLNFGCMLSLATPYVEPKWKGKDIFAEIWKEVEWYLKLERPPRTLDQYIAKDLAKSRNWMKLQLDCEDIGIRLQEAILEDLLEETILSCINGSLDSGSPVLLQAEVEESGVNVEI